MTGIHARAEYVWEQFKLSIWLIPLTMSIASIILAILTLNLDDRYGHFIADNFRYLRIDAQGARQVIAVISGAMMTITGVVFSISVVALTLASNQFGPKILRNYLRDTSNKIVLGLFVSTFLYGLVVLASIDTQHGGFIPLFSILTCIGMTIVAIGALIYFIHNISTAIQADHIIASIAEELNNTISNTLSRMSDDPQQMFDKSPPHSLTDKKKITLTQPVYSPESGYIQAINYQSILQQTIESNVCFILEKRAGDFILENSPIGVLHHFTATENIDTGCFFNAILFGRQRTPIQDIEFSITQLLQIALRALSPGINDSITAITCINWLGSSLGRMSLCQFPSSYFTDDEGICRIDAKTFSFKGAVNAVFNPLRQNTRNNEVVSIHLLEILVQLMRTTKSKDYRRLLHAQAKYLFNDCQQSFSADPDINAAKTRFLECESIMSSE